MEAGLKLNIKNSEVIGIENINDHNNPCVAGIISCKNSDNYKCLIANNRNAFSMKKCPIDKWTAMTIIKTYEQIFRSWPVDACFTCGSREFWSRPGDQMTCAMCHPQIEDKKWRSTMTFSSKSKSKRTTGRSSKSSLKQSAQESVFSTPNDGSLSGLRQPKIIVNTTAH